MSEVSGPTREARPAGRLLATARRAFGVLSTVWRIVGIALLWLLLLNLAAWLRLRSLHDETSAVEMAKISLDTQDPAVWQAFGEEYIRLDGARVLGGGLRWEPYSYWRFRETKGTFINIGADGLRTTVSPKRVAADAPQVYLFGGSTMWCAGVRDEHTIASCLARLLSAAGIEAQVINYGQMGYVSTQERIAFEEACRAGQAPTVAVFYTGVNDVVSAIVNGKAGLTLRENHRREEFNLLNQPTPWPTAAACLKSLPLYRWLTPEAGPQGEFDRRTTEVFAAYARDLSNQPESRQRLAASLAERPLASGESTSDRLLEVMLEELMADVVAAQAQNAGIVEAVGRMYGTRVILVWQPTVFTKRAPSTHEREMVDREVLLRKAFRSAGERISEGAALSTSRVDVGAHSTRFKSLAAAMDGPEWSSKTTYYDFCHTSERGNLAVAKALLPLIVEALQQASDPGAAKQP
jgi:hypothetical protein